MSEIRSNKAGLDPQTYQEAKDLLSAWDYGPGGGGTGEALTLDYQGRGKFALWTKRPDYWNQLIYIGPRAGAFAYIRGMIHGKQGRINL